MACFLVPAAEAAVTTIAAKAMKSKERGLPVHKIAVGSGFENVEAIPFSKKLNWLSKLLWGGSALLCFEHVWARRGRPLLSISDGRVRPRRSGVMLDEMASVGGSMALF